VSIIRIDDAIVPASFSNEDVPVDPAKRIVALTDHQDRRMFETSTREIIESRYYFGSGTWADAFMAFVYSSG
jgi:hypothetical protein